MLVSSSLVTEPTKVATHGFKSRWSPKARRWYQRLLSGVTHHQGNRRRLRVITLTSGPAALGLDLNDSFQALLKRIRRRWASSGFEYWKLRTSEGLGVLHIIFSGPWIPHSWLSRSWEEVHASPIVYIQELRQTRKKMISYLMRHYLPAHDDGRLYTRMSWSWGWVFRGFVGAWRWFWKRGPTRYDAIFEWNKLMCRAEPLVYYKMKRGTLYEQTVLKKRGIMGTVVFSQAV